MDLRRIRTFVAVAELGTVSKASAHLRIAQPALSRQIGSFEEELGLKLFDRIGSRLVLSGEGEQMLVECRALLNHAQAVGERAHLLGRGDTGVLKVAASPQFIEGVLCDYLHHYVERYPHVQVKLVEAIGWADTQGMLERGEIHLGQNLLRAVQPGDARFASHPLEAVDLLAACHEPLPLNRTGAIEVARLVEHPLLLLDTSFVSRRSFDSACRLAGIETHIVFESRTPHTLLAMAERGHGVALVPSAVQINRYTLHTARVTHRGESLREPLAIFWDARRPLPRYATAFCEQLAVHVRQVFPITRTSEPAVEAKRERATAKTGRQ
jgi:DNA-binding transcriptional LysR family regulator